MKGVDVSQHNGVINWQALQENGVEFAMLRLGVGSDIPEQDDTMFSRNVLECERLGIPYGVYIYSYALNYDNLQSEIAHTKRMIAGLNPLYVAFDMEDADGYKANNGLVPEENGETLTDFCNIFTREFENGIVYASLNFFTNILGGIEAPKWVACWVDEEPNEDNPPFDCVMWQYTSDQVFDGVRYDMNILYDNVSRETHEEQEQETEPDRLEQPTKARCLTDACGNVQDVNGVMCHCWYEEYDIIDTNNDGVCLGINGVVFARIPWDRVELY